jgi:cytosine/adenosine deaminase-related metal-dependent hydrolase
MRRIAASFVFPLGGREPIRNGFIEYADDGTIAAIGKCEDPGGESEFLSGQAIVPGFVNSHCHVELSYMRGLFKKGTGMAGFIDQINALRDTKSMEERKRDIVYWMDKMWSRGVQAMADISNCADSFEIKQKSPMYTRTFLEVFGTEPEDSAEVIRNVLQLQSIASGFGIDAAPTPHACYTMSPQLLTAVSREGLKSGFLSYHSEETPEEEEMLKYGRGKMWENRKAAGMSVPPVTGKSSLLYFIDRLKEAHPAPFDEHILLVHEVCMDQEGIDAVKAVMRHPYIALCPCSNIFIHNALPPIELMRRNGLRLTIGTDSLSSNDDLDIVREMYCLQHHFEDVSLNELLTWACQNGAEFLEKEDIIGTLESGKKPGLVAISNISENASLTFESASNRII